MAERKHGVAALPTETEVRHEDWGRQDISGQSHNRVAFVDVDFTEVTNHGAMFTECTFRNCRFNASSHSDAAFVNRTFTGCSFFDATFTSCKLVGSMFDRCTSGLLKVSGGVNLSRADLRGSDLSTVDPVTTELSGAVIDVEQALALAGALGLQVRPDVPRQ